MTGCLTGGAHSSRSVLAWLTLTLALTACASGTRGTRVPPPQIDPALLIKAPEQLPPATGPQLRELIGNHRLVTKRYHETAAQLNALIETVTPQEPDPPWWQFWRIYF